MPKVAEDWKCLEAWQTEERRWVSAEDSDEHSGHVVPDLFVEKSEGQGRLMAVGCD